MANAFKRSGKKENKLVLN